VVQKVESEFGEIDILANAAGVLRVTESIDFSEEDWDFVLNTNLKGTFLMNQAVARGMIKRKRGSIINIASTDAFNPIPNQAAYNCSKIGVRHLTNTLAFEWGRHNVRVNAIAPGCVHTEMMASYGIDDSVASAEIALGRMGEPMDIANTALFLASDLACWVAGVTWRVDGGTNMGPLSMWPEEQT
jgi:NAD(P)-dependent dehydrogenase (short-subunit alcohol dehydrogenase family)